MAISRTNSNRLTGLATGIDTDAMIKNMMRAQQAKVDKYTQKKQLDEWRQETYVDLTKGLRKLKNDYLDIIKSGDNNLLKNSTYNTLKSEMKDSDKGNLEVSGSVGAVKGNYKVKVNSLATTAKVQSNIKPGTTLDMNENMSKYMGDIGKDESLKITVGEDVFEFKMDSDMKLGDFLKDLKNTTIKDDKGNEKSLSSLVNISCSTITNKLTFETLKTGEKSSIKVEGSIAGKLGINTAEVKGTNAEIEVKLPGETEYSKVTSETNTFTRDNITFNLKEADATKEIAFNLKPDATEVVDKIEKFVDSYNELVTKIESLLSEQSTGYKPLTEEEKGSLSDKEIERWESQAKKGLFRNDRQLESMVFSLRKCFSDSISGCSTNFRNIGIDTKKDGNTISLDKDKLKAALENNGDEVYKMFTKDTELNITHESTAAEKQQAYNERGIFRRISAVLDEYSGSEGVFVKKAGFENSRWATQNDLTKSILKQEKAITEMQNRMYQKENAYYSQFARLEEAMNKLNSQSNWLASQLGGMS